MGRHRRDQNGDRIVMPQVPKTFEVAQHFGSAFPWSVQFPTNTGHKLECAAGFSKMEMATVLIAGTMTGGRNFGNVSVHDRENLLRRTSQDAADLAQAVFNELAARAEAEKKAREEAEAAAKEAEKKPAIFTPDSEPESHP